MESTINIIAAFSTKDFAIGKQNELPWDIPEDLQHFSSLTKGSIVVMGRKTYESIPDIKRPLKNRINIVLTSAANAFIPKQHLQDTQLYYVSNEIELDGLLNNLQKTTQKQVFVIGGERLYSKYMGVANTIYATLIDKKVEAPDRFFPLDNFGMYSIHSYSPMFTSDNEKCTFRHVVYKRDKTAPNNEKCYTNLLCDIFENGTCRPDRTGTGTRSVFSRQLRFDLKNNKIPFITTKQLAYKTVIKELLFFLRAETDSKVLEKQGVNIWRDNTTRDFLDKRGLAHYQEGDMGPMYFYQVRHWGHPYEGCSADYKGKGHDQLEALITGLKEDPFSRRHLLTTYNPTDVPNSVLAPCHGLCIMFYVDTDATDSAKLLLSCQVVIRSSDVALGLPFNIASYALLTRVIAEKVNMGVNELIVTTGDTHIYLNLESQLQQQLARPILPQPLLELDPSLKNKTFEEIELDDFNIVGYLHHPPIRMPMAV